MKENIFILGDSYSTYAGYIPNGYRFYYSDEREALPIIKGVDKTWWSILAKKNELNIVVNDSYSGSTVCNTVRADLDISTSFVNRVDGYVARDFFAKNKIDRVFIFGGTNDSWLDCPIGDLQYFDWTEADLKCVLPAFCYIVAKLKEFVGGIVIIINTQLKDEIARGFICACQKYGVEYILLEDIDKENGHPTELGMEQISSQISAFLEKL